jgi:RimJ/RimL family protein N-acetyltransferase
VFAPGYPIRTDRLSLRPFTEDDFDAVYAIHSNHEVARYLYWEPRGRDATWELLKERFSMVTIDNEGDRLSLAIERTDTGATIGQATLMYRSAEHSQGEIGYVLHPDHHGQGFATEVAVALLRLGFEGLKLHRLFGRCDGRNTASARVLAKAGMRQEAHLRENEFVKGEWTDELVYALLATEWQTAAR